ncbi:hypothetical protein HK104_006977, partial [Borealophlyctis nickersoniae]
SLPQVTSKKILVLTDKHEGKDAAKLVEKYMKPVWDAISKPHEIKAVQYNEFSIANVLSMQDWKKMGNVVCTTPDFTPRLQQVLVRNQYADNPANLPCEGDPVDAALSILRSNIGRSKQGVVHVTGVHLKREEGKIAGMFKFK